MLSKIFVNDLCMKDVTLFLSLSFSSLRGKKADLVWLFGYVFVCNCNVKLHGSCVYCNDCIVRFSEEQGCGLELKVL